MRRDGAAGRGGVGARAFVALQYVLPQHALSRLVRAATRVRWRWFKIQGSTLSPGRKAGVAVQ